MHDLFLKKNLKIDNGLQCPGCRNKWSITEKELKEPGLLARFKRVMGFKWPAGTRAYSVPLKQDYEHLRLDTEGVPEMLSLCLRCCVGYLKELTGQLWDIDKKARVELSMRWNRLSELGVAAVFSPHLRAELLQKLTEAGVLQIEGEFNGRGNEAQLDSLEVTKPENVELLTDLATELEDLLMEDIVWEGADDDYHGSIVVDVGRGEVTVYYSSDFGFFDESD
jgi:hypothetical protein